MFLAKSEDGAAGQSAAPMLQTLLEQRFKVKVHKGTKSSAVYILTVANGGPKLQPSKTGSCIEMDLNNIRPPAPPRNGETMPNYCGNRPRKKQRIVEGRGLVRCEYGGTCGQDVDW